MKLRYALVAAGCALALGGCYTMEGIGTDVARLAPLLPHLQRTRRRGP